MYQGKSTFGLMVQELCAEGGYAVLLIHLQRQQCSQIYIRRLLQVQAPTVYSALAKNLASYNWMTMATLAFALIQMILKTIIKACFSRLYARTVTKVSVPAPKWHPMAPKCGSRVGAVHVF